MQLGWTATTNPSQLVAPRCFVSLRVPRAQGFGCQEALVQIKAGGVLEAAPYPLPGGVTCLGAVPGHVSDTFAPFITPLTSALCSAAAFLSRNGSSRS